MPSQNRELRMDLGVLWNRLEETEETAPVMAVIPADPSLLQD